MQPIIRNSQGNPVTLNIPMVKRSDNGTYYCVAGNKVGNKSEAISLIVIGKNPPR